MKMEELKKLISSILISCPMEMTVIKLDRDYAEQIGERIPYRKFGFSTLEQCLLSMPDVLQLRGTGMHAEVSVKVSSKVAHIDKLISQQRVTTSSKKAPFGKRPKRHTRRRSGQPLNPFPQSNSNHIPPLCSSPLQIPRVPPLMPPSYTGLPLPTPYHTIPYRMLSYPLYYSPTNFKNTVIPPVHNSTTRPPPKPHRYSPPPRFTQPPKFEATLVPSGQKTLQQTSPIMNSTSLGTLKSKSPDSTPVISSTGAIPKETNYRRDLSPPPCSEIVSDDVYISDSEDADEYETYIPGLRNTATTDQTLACLRITESAQEPTHATSNAANVPRNVQRNLRMLINGYDDGIWCAKLPNIYLEMFSKELDFMEYGYRSLITMCMELDDIFHCIRPDNGDFKLYDKQKPLPQDYDKSLKVSELLKACSNLSSPPTTEPALAEAENLKDIFSYPPEVMELYEEIPKLFLSPDVKEYDYIDVKVGEVYDPSKFWILLNEYYKDFECLMDELHSFYSDGKPEYEIPEHMLTAGLYCAAVYNHEYHRAIIVKMLPQDAREVKVFYVDYGTVSAVSTKGLYFLHRKFSYMPQQAIRARLAKIYPPLAQTQWSTRASSYLLSLVTNKVLVAQIYRIDTERSIVEIFLVDTTGKDDIFMNDALVNEGFAIFTYQEQQKTKLNKNEVPRVKHIHLFPTFNELELGIVPSAAEVFKFMRGGASVYVTQPHYFFPDFDIDDIKDLDLLKDEDLVDYQNECLVEDQNECLTEDQNEYLTEHQNECLTDDQNKCLPSTDDSQIGGCGAAEPKWTQLWDAEQARSDENLTETISNLSELNINPLSSHEPDSAGQSSPSPEIVYTKPIRRPPPGFEDVQPISMPNDDGLKSTVVRQTASVNPDDVLLLNYMLACQQNELLNLMPSQPVLTNIHSPMMLPPVVNPPINYLSKTQQMLSMLNHQPLAQLSTPSNLFYQLAMQHQLQSQLHMQNIYRSQAQNKIIDQQQKCREILQKIINQQLVNGNESLLAHLKHILKESGSVFGQEDAFELLSSVCANQSLLISGMNSSEIFNELLNLLSDNQIVELAQKAKELSMVSSSANNNTSDNLVTDGSAPVLNFPINVGDLSKVDAEVQVSDNSNMNHQHKINNKKDVRNDIVHQIEKKMRENNRHRRHVIQINWNSTPIHVIWFRSCSYVIINEILQFTAKKAAIEMIRKIVVMLDPSSVVVDLALSEHPDVAQELLRYHHYDPNSILQIIPSMFVPKIIEILGSNDNCTDCGDFLTKVDANSDLWLQM